MTDHWRHLNGLSEARGRTYAGLLKNDVAGAHIVDLNCGKAPVFYHVEGFASYYGNDVQPDFIEELVGHGGENARFELKPDKDVTVDRVDILMMLGACGIVLHWGPNPESTTDLQTFMRLIKEHHPKVVVLESATEVWGRMNVTQVDEDIRREGYVLDQMTTFALGEGEYTRRVVGMWRRSAT